MARPSGRPSLCDSVPAASSDEGGDSKGLVSPISGVNKHTVKKACCSQLGYRTLETLGYEVLQVLLQASKLLHGPAMSEGLQVFLPGGTPLNLELRPFELRHGRPCQELPVGVRGPRRPGTPTMCVFMSAWHVGVLFSTG